MKPHVFYGAVLALAIGFASSVLAFLIATSSVLALDRAEAEAVVSIMEALTDEMGGGMATEAAGIFYDYDQYGAALIPAAGFDRAGWIDAYDAVAAGYMATIPQDEFDAVFEEPLALLEESGLPEDQKAAMRAHMDGLIAEANAVRQAGMVHAAAVEPLENRLYPLFYGAFGE